MRSLKLQTGVSSFMLLLLLVVGGFSLTCLLKLGPHYLDNMYIDNALKSLVENGQNLNEMSHEKIMAQLERFMTVNNVRGQEGKAFKIIRKNDRTLINNEYEVRVPMFINIDVVLTFRSQLDSTNPEACCEFLVENEN